VTVLVLPSGGSALVAVETSSAADDSWENLGALINNVLRTFGSIEARNESVGNLDVNNQVYDVTARSGWKCWNTQV
jgi:hypothetical protein